MILKTGRKISVFWDPKVMKFIWLHAWPSGVSAGRKYKNVERGCFARHGRKAVKWKHICVKRNGHSATCEPEAGTLHRRSRRRKVETRMWMGANGDNMEMENKCCCWRDAAKTSSHPCRMNMWFVLLKWTSTSGRFNIIYVNKEQNYWKKRTHKWKTVGREYFFSLLVLADISCHQVKFITVLTFKTLDQLFCRRPERRDNPTGAGGIPLQTKTEGGPLGAADHWVHINTVEAEELALQLNPLYILLN